MRDYLLKNRSYKLSQDEKEGLSQFPVQFTLDDDGETIKADIYYSPEYLAMVDADLDEGKLNENRPHPTEVFTDEELDYIGDMMVAMYEKLGLADEEDPSSTNVVKALALSDRIEGFFETLN